MLIQKNVVKIWQMLSQVLHLIKKVTQIKKKITDGRAFWDAGPLGLMATEYV